MIPSSIDLTLKLKIGSAAFFSQNAEAIKVTLATTLQTSFITNILL
jgi:hypothetical protein